MASFVLGLPLNAARLIGTSQGDMIGNAWSLYFQDNWKVTPKLSLNLGIRYDYVSPMVNRNGSGTFEWETGQYLFTKTNPVTGEAPNAPPGLLQPDRNNFAPRVGISYQLGSKTVVRASYGLFYDSFGVNYGQTQQGNRGNWPFAFPQTASSLNSGLPDAIFPNVFPGPAQGSRVPLGCQQCLNAFPATSRTPYVHEYTASIQRQLTTSMVLEGVYFGSRGEKLSGQIIDNSANPPGPGPVAARQKYPQFPSYVDNEDVGSLGGRISQYPNVTGDPKLSNPTLQRWFNTGAFSMPAIYTSGNARRNILRQDGYADWDCGIQKQFALKEGRFVEFRAESINALNITVFGQPNSQFGTSTFGQVTRVRQSGRIITAGVRLHF